MPDFKVRWPWIILGIVVLLVLWVIVAYNGLVTSHEKVDTQWANVQTVYQRRMDLIPNVVSTVKGAASFEQSTMLAVTEARTKWLSGGSRGEQIGAAQQFDSALSRLLVTVESYPQLKATEAFRDLTTELEGTENRIAVARRDFNEAVMAYNLNVKRFPGALIAGMFGFAPEAFFQADAGSDKAPVVDFQ